jgi:hypothetical protein
MAFFSKGSFHPQPRKGALSTSGAFPAATIFPYFLKIDIMQSNKHFEVPIGERCTQPFSFFFQLPACKRDEPCCPGSNERSFSARLGGKEMRWNFFELFMGKMKNSIPT